MSDYDIFIAWFVENIPMQKIADADPSLTINKVRTRVERVQNSFLSKHGKKIAKLVRKMEREDKQRLHALVSKENA